jgi:hypothetical protein
MISRSPRVSSILLSFLTEKSVGLKRVKGKSRVCNKSKSVIWDVKKLKEQMLVS